MADTRNIPVSITHAGRTMERTEVVEYLKVLSQHVLIRMELEKELEELRAELAEETKEEKGKAILPPEPDPPLKESYPLLTLIGVPFLIICILLSDFSAAEKAAVAVVSIAALLFSLIRHRCANERAQADWEERKAAYEKEMERIQNLNSEVTAQDPPAVAELKNQLSQTEEAYEKICASLEYQEKRDILAPNYRKGIIPCILYGFFMDGRVNTLSEAVNLFHEEMHRQNQEQNQLRQQQEMEMHLNALMLQQNLNAARLSSQIEDAKNEIELQILMDSLYTTDMINLLRKEMQ